MCANPAAAAAAAAAVAAAAAAACLLLLLPCTPAHIHTDTILPSSAQQQQQQVAPESAAAAAVAAAAVQPTEWFQKTITLPQLKRGCHVITRKVLAELPEVTEYEVGLANLFSE
jgi:hypothetical protein